MNAEITNPSIQYLGKSNLSGFKGPGWYFFDGPMECFGPFKERHIAEQYQSEYNELISHYLTSEV